jgi:HD-GYP domain-containing protein (c-di-GMP phosphodiesterase class II)
MSNAIRFLHALAQAFSAITLYSPGHPAAQRAMEAVWDALRTLLSSDHHPTFYFLGGAPVYNGRALHELSDWPWSSRLRDSGVQRLEFDESVVQGSLDRFLGLMQLRFSAGPAPEPLFPEDAEFSGLRFGPVAVVEVLGEEDDSDPTREDDDESRELALDLTDELAATAYIIAEARRGVLARAEAEAVVRILAAQLDRHELPQAAMPEDHAAYPQYHAVNTALLTMAAGNNAGVDRPGQHRLGVVGLLHDIGMARLPEDFTSRESLTPEERALMETHTVEGARFLLEHGGRALDLAAAVAYEHHLRPDGTGYPARRFAPPLHWASRMVGVAATYVSLRTPRPYRPAWAPLRAVAYLEEGAGSVFDRESAAAIASLVRVS